MTLIPDEELRKQESLNLAPMVDFLFLVIAVLATLAVSRAVLFDTEVELVTTQSEQKDSPLPPYNDPYLVILSVAQDGTYKWISEFNEFPMSGVQGVQNELKKQQQLGLLPQDPKLSKILLHIDKGATWDPIAQLVFGIRELGFQIHPVYEQE